MADTRKLHTFWEQYLWRAEDFSNFQTWIYNTIYALAEGRSGVLKGLTVTPLGAMSVRVSAGIGITPAGKILVLPTQTDIAMTSPVGNPSKSYLVLRASDSVSDQIQEPTNPLNTVTFTTLKESTALEIAGTPAGSPVYPSLAADDLVLMGFGFTAGLATITSAHYEMYKRHSQKRSEMNIRRLTAAVTMDGSEEVLEFDTSGGAIEQFLPSVYTMLGKVLTCVKISSDSNEFKVNGDGTETINGSLTWEGDTQWQTFRLYASPAGWVVI